MRQYTKLPIPSDSAWDRKTWRKYTPTWLVEFVDGVKNIFRWMPTIYKDKDWDDFYILAMLRKKIEHQREYLVKANRHMDIERDNKNMTLALNLLERMIDEYYACEYVDCIQFNFVPHPTSGDDMYTIEETITESKLDEYLAKYPLGVKKAEKKIKNDKLVVGSLGYKRAIAFHLATENQLKNDRLFWRIMSEKSKNWWD